MLYFIWIESLKLSTIGWRCAKQELSKSEVNVKLSCFNDILLTLNIKHITINLSVNKKVKFNKYLNEAFYRQQVKQKPNTMT